MRRLGHPCFRTIIVSKELLQLHVQEKVQFIHRTAYDFLTENEEGFRVRAYDSSSRDSQLLLLARINLVEIRLYRPKCNYNSERVLFPLSLITSPGVNNQIHETLQVCWKWYDREDTFYIWDRDKDPLHRLPLPHFLAAVLPGFKDFVLSTIAASPDPPSPATLILRDMSFLRWKVDDPFEATRTFLKPLISLGANS